MSPDIRSINKLFLKESYESPFFAWSSMTVRHSELAAADQYLLQTTLFLTVRLIGARQ